MKFKIIFLSETSQKKINCSDNQWRWAYINMQGRLFNRFYGQLSAESVSRKLISTL